MRLTNETLTINIAAVMRNPDELFHLTEAEDLQASFDLGHNKSDRKKAEAAVDDVEAMDSGLGYSREGGETWGTYGSWSEETCVPPPQSHSMEPLPLTSHAPPPPL